MGVSLSDSELGMAIPLLNISVDSDYFEALDSIEDLVVRHDVNTVVVGLPLNMNGTEGKAAKKARRWSQQLSKRLNELAVQVILQDERLTTVSAHHQLNEVGRSSKQHRSVVDQQSAVLILQAALDRAEYCDKREANDGRA